jgi:hypothetical protein
MASPEILIPFGLPPAEHAKDLVRLLSSKCNTDGLAMLISRYQSLVRERFDDFSPQLPHEAWLTKHFNHSFVQHYANKLNVQLSAGHWFVLQPVHLHIARNHLVLTDYRQLNLSESDALLLFEKAQTLCQEAGVECVFGSAHIWFLRADNWTDLITSSPDAACGHNIEIWSAKGAQELAWRKLQNEIQMAWFAHPINQQREARGEPMINGLWLWGGAHLITKKNTLLSSSNSAQFFLAPPELTLIDQLTSSALANDWGRWAESMIELEHSWFKPIFNALKERKLDQIQLHLSNSNTLLSVQTNRMSLYQFWRRPTLNNLIK